MGAGFLPAAVLRKALGEKFKEIAPLSAAGAATQILDGMRADCTRILVGEDAVVIDLLARVRTHAAAVAVLLPSSTQQ